jgi:DNA-binding transcriptional LysR family regulator
MEESTGASLFLRLHRGVVATKKGELLYPHAKRLIREIDALESALRLDA